MSAILHSIVVSIENDRISNLLNGWRILCKLREIREMTKTNYSRLLFELSRIFEELESCIVNIEMEKFDEEDLYCDSCRNKHNVLYTNEEIFCKVCMIRYFLRGYDWDEENYIPEPQPDVVFSILYSSSEIPLI